MNDLQNVVKLLIHYILTDKLSVLFTILKFMGSGFTELKKQVLRFFFHFIGLVTFKEIYE